MTYQLPPDVACVIDETTEELQVFLMRLPDGAPVVLKDSASLIWLAATTSDDPVQVVAEAVGEDRDSIEVDVNRFLCDLVADGLLEKAGRDPAPRA